jgi:hypothetical protein
VIGKLGLRFETEVCKGKTYETQRDESLNAYRNTTKLQKKSCKDKFTLGQDLVHDRVDISEGMTFENIAERKKTTCHEKV